MWHNLVEQLKMEEYFRFVEDLNVNKKDVLCANDRIIQEYRDIDRTINQ
jgi:hypothetical protein